MPRDRSLLSGVALGGLLLTGCSTFAVYQDPVTGQRMECETNQIVTGMGGFGGPGQSPYADCKTTLEERGYKRVDTRDGDYQKPGSAEPQPVTSTK